MHSADFDGQFQAEDVRVEAAVCAWNSYKLQTLQLYSFCRWTAKHSPTTLSESHGCRDCDGGLVRRESGGSSCIVHAKRPASLPKGLGRKQAVDRPDGRQGGDPVGPLHETDAIAGADAHQRLPTVVTVFRCQSAYTELRPHLQDVDLVAGQQLWRRRKRQEEDSTGSAVPLVPVLPEAVSIPHQAGIPCTGVAQERGFRQNPQTKQES